MTEIKLKKRYPHSRTEDITDAFMRGYEQGKKDGLKVGKQIVLGAFETYINADRKTENSSEIPNNSTSSKMEQVDKDINVRSKDEPKTDMAEDIVRSYGFKAESYQQAKAKDEPQTDCAWK